MSQRAAAEKGSEESVCVDFAQKRFGALHLQTFDAEEIAKEKLQTMSGGRCPRPRLCQTNQSLPCIRPIVPARLKPPMLHETSGDVLQIR